MKLLLKLQHQFSDLSSVAADAQRSNDLLDPT